MKKASRKSKLFISLVILAVILTATAAIIRVNHSKKCEDIIGDGYAMGTDPKPIVIGKTCE
jgi:flagellar basal body-associated protein FliL